MENKKINIILICTITLILIVTIVIAIMTFTKNEKPQNLVNSVANVEENVAIENTVVNETVEKPEVLPALKNKGEIAKKRSVFTDGYNKTAVVPTGYAITNDSTNINDGLVISDIATDDLGNSKGGNQFVLIPVENAVIDVSKCKDETEINDAIAGYVEKQKYPMAMKMSDGNYRGILYRFESINEDTAIKVGFIAYSESANEREPANIDDSSAFVKGWTQQLYQTEFNELVKRVNNDGGFWVARFETSVDSNNVAQSKKDQKVLTNTSWYNLYTTEKSLTNGTTTSHMIWGCQWDQIMIWMKDIRNNNINQGSRYFVINSNNMGNYLNTEIKISDEQTKRAGEAFRFKAGEVSGTMIKNIYDLAGNAWEWTMEANFTNSRTARGGDCSFDGAYYPVSTRFSFQPTYTGEKLENIGSRMILY